MKRPEISGIIALFMVYILWGSTYLGIRLAVETIPPLIACMGRHGFGGISLALGLIVFERWVCPTRRECMAALAVGSLTAGISNGALMWAEVNVPSAYAAISFTTMPLFMLFFNWGAFARVRPSVADFLAMPLGLLGIGLIVGKGESLIGGQIGLFDVALLIICPSVWALGSLLARKWTMPKDILVSSSLQMMGGATLLTILSLLHGDWARLDLGAITSRSYWGLGYLAIGGSLLGYTAFSTAIHHLDFRVVGTYAFVTPIVAVVLGYLLGEQVTSLPIIAGSALAIASVVLTFIGARKA